MTNRKKPRKKLDPPIEINKTVKSKDLQKLLREVVGTKHGAKSSAARIIGITRPTLDLWLDGDRTPIIIANVVYSLRKFGYDVEEVFEVKTPKAG